MSKPLALFFAVLTALLFVGIAGAIAYRNPWAVILLALAACTTIFIGLRIKRKSQQKEQK
ncbi:MAG: hypothetical protein C0P68_000850 [Bacillota bacterium]|nr:hypothetical protein [Bacillota bacterium]